MLFYILPSHLDHVTNLPFDACYNYYHNNYYYFHTCHWFQNSCVATFCLLPLLFTVGSRLGWFTAALDFSWPCACSLPHPGGWFSRLDLKSGSTSSGTGCSCSWGRRPPTWTSPWPAWACPFTLLQFFLDIFFFFHSYFLVLWILFTFGVFSTLFFSLTEVLCSLTEVFCS